MFRYSTVASDLTCKHTKTQAITCVESALKFPYSLICDDSNEKGDNVKLLTILMRSNECENSSVVTRHLDTVGITCVTSADIFHSIKDVLLKYGLNFSNVIAFVFTHAKL